VRQSTTPGLVTSDAHAGLVDAVGATLPGTGWQRCRTHLAANLMAATPKSSWPWVKVLLHSVYDQPDATSVHAQFDRIVEALTGKLPTVSAYLEEARRSKTMAATKRAELDELYRHECRAAPWQGTALRVLQATNTWAQHLQTVRRTSRPERNLLNAISGTTSNEDRHILDELMSLVSAA
jgi:transposase-like protein